MMALLPGWRVFEFPGEFSGAVARKFRDDCQRAVDSGETKVAILLDKVDFVDSSGIGALIYCRQRLVEKKGRFVLVGMKSDIRDLFEMISILILFENVEKVEDLQVGK